TVTLTPCCQLPAVSVTDAADTWHSPFDAASGTTTVAVGSLVNETVNVAVPAGSLTSRLVGATTMPGVSSSPISHRLKAVIARPVTMLFTLSTLDGYRCQALPSQRNSTSFDSSRPVASSSS